MANGLKNGRNLCADVRVTVRMQETNLSIIGRKFQGMIAKNKNHWRGEKRRFSHLRQDLDDGEFC